MMIECNFQPAAFEIGHSVHQVMLKKPGRQRRRRKTRIASRYAKEEDFLPARKDSSSEDVWKKFAQPRATCKGKVAGNDPFPRACRNGIQESRSMGGFELRQSVFI